MIIKGLFTFIIWMLGLGMATSVVFTGLSFISAGLYMGISFLFMAACIIALAVLGTILIWKF